MTTTLPPHTVAQAIAELGRERIEQAWRHLEATRILGGGDLTPEERRSRLGYIPPTVLRHALEHPEQDTEALRKVRAWNSRGIAAEHGEYCGTGKTHAAAMWLLAGFDLGIRGSWLAAADWPFDYSSKEGRARQQLFLDVGAKAGRLVLDDIGAGTTGTSGTGRPWSAEPMAGMLMGRVDDGRPTLILTNSNLENLKVWLGPRVGSRLQMGGGMIEIFDTVDKRKADDTPLDKHGRSPTWHANAAIIEVIGCRRGDDGLVFGDNLVAACEQADRDARLGPESERKTIRWKPVTRAIHLLGLDPAEVTAHANKMHRREEKQREKFRTEVQREFDLDVESCDLGGVAAALFAKLNKDKQLHSLQVEREFFGRMGERIPDRLRSSDVETARLIAERAGLWVIGNVDEGFVFGGKQGVVKRGIRSPDRAWVEAAMYSHTNEIGAVA